MGCNCTKTEGFKEKMAKAKAATESTGEIHVVFVQKAVKQTFMCKESDLTDSLGICCYYLPTGEEVIYTSKNVAEITVIEEVLSEEKPKSKKKATDA